MGPTRHAKQRIKARTAPQLLKVDALTHDRWHPFRIATALVFALVAASPAQLQADEVKALPCRPTNACTADVVPAGALELEAGYLARRLQFAPTTSTGQWQQGTPFLLKLTLVEWLQLQAGSNGLQVLGDQAYFDNLLLGLKAHARDQSKQAPSLALSVTASLPTATTGGDSRMFNLFSTAYASKDFAWLHADLNAGMNAWRVARDAQLQGWVALALSTELPHKLSPMLETYYFSPAGTVAARDGGVLMALAWAARPWLVVDAGGDVGMFPSTRPFSLFVGVTAVLADFWESEAEFKLRTGHGGVVR